MATRKEISKFLWRHLLLTLFLSCFFSGLISLLLFSDGSDGLESHEASTLIVLLGVFWAFVLTACSGTVFFNLDPAVANNRFYNFISFYFVPLAAVISVAVVNPATGAWLQYLAVTAPFFILHTFFYRQFNKRLAAAK